MAKVLRFPLKPERLKLLFLDQPRLSSDYCSCFMPVMLKYLRCFGVELSCLPTVNGGRWASKVWLLTGTGADTGGWSWYFGASELIFKLRCKNCSEEDTGRRGGRMWRSSPRIWLLHPDRLWQTAACCSTSSIRLSIFISCSFTFSSLFNSSFTSSMAEVASVTGSSEKVFIQSDRRSNAFHTSYLAWKIPIKQLKR